MFFKRLSRSRGNSYVSDDYEKVTPPDTATSGGRPPSSYNTNNNPAAVAAANQATQSARTSTQLRRDISDPRSAISIDEADAEKLMYAPRPGDSAYPQKETAYPSSGNIASSQRGTVTNGMSPRGGPTGQHATAGSYDSEPPLKPADLSAQAPDLLTRAFNEALRPYTEKIEQLEEQLANMQEYLQSQEQQRLDIFAWIDKRGLRPDVPPHIAKILDDTNDAATSLNAQLDRKITIVNFDLHRLQDDLNDSISSAHFASAMAKFVPDIRRLSSLHTGPKFAYELVIKLVGNLNSHGGLEAGGLEDEHDVQDDRAARTQFYERMDAELVEVIRRRLEEHEEWAVAREVKRLEKNANYLKNLGIDSYFPRSLIVMRQEVEFRNGAATGQSPSRY